MKSTAIKTKFKVGDKVWTIYERLQTDWIECPACKGIPIRKIKGHPFVCDTCRDGQVRKESGIEYTIDTGVIVKVWAEITKDGIDVGYVAGESVDDDGGIAYDGEEIEDMYASKKQAQKEIERRKAK
jgi:hypothetical protein